MSTISAGNTTTTSIRITGDTTGNLVFATGGANATALTLSNTQAATFANAVTVTGALTATGGVVQGANAAPAFSAYMSSNLDVTDNVITKVPCNTEEFDTASCYDNATNYRFTPTVAGYYQVTVQCYYNTNANRPTSFFNLIYKNGVSVKTNYLFATSTTLLGQAPLTALIYCNGTTDYLEFYARASGGTSQFFSSGSTNTFFQAFLARSA
jgi:hypothetical protein